MLGGGRDGSVGLPQTQPNYHSLETFVIKTCQMFLSKVRVFHIQLFDNSQKFCFSR